MIGFTLDTKPEQSQKAFRSKEAVVGKAAMAAIREVSDDVKKNGRAAIARSGFSPRWQAAFRVEIYPRRGFSINAAAFVYHKIRYAGVFEEGATISGSPYLWIPFPSAPKRIGRFKITPKLYIENIGKLIFLRRSGRPILAGRVNSRSSGRISVSALRRGERDARRASASRALGGSNSGKYQTNIVPIFFGVPTVKIRGRFGLQAIFNQARASLSAAYFRNLKDE